MLDAFWSHRFALRNSLLTRYEGPHIAIVTVCFVP